jgi:alpha-glucosidase
LPSFYGSDDDELHLAFNIRFIFEKLGPGMADVVDLVEQLFQSHAWPAWVGSNHDVSRFPTRWAKGDERKVRLALMMLMTLRGTPFLYYGDEIGMADRPFSKHEVLDPVGVRFHPVAGRDPERTPMQWSGGPGAGFTSPDATPWLPFGDAAACNVADQRDDERSVLHLARELIALRRSFARKSYERVPGDIWMFRRGVHTIVLNVTDEPVTLEIDGAVALSTSRDLDGQSAGGLSLPPWEGVVVSS